jgi:hypothetical protein
MGDALALSHCSLPRNLCPKPTGVLEHCREGNPNVGSTFSRAFSSDRIPKTTKDVNVHFFLHSRNSRKLHQPSERTSEVTSCYTNVWENVCNLILLQYSERVKQSRYRPGVA